MTGRRWRLAGCTIAWFAVLALVYVMFVGQWDAIDWVGAGVTATIAAGLTATLLREGLLSFRGHISWCRQLPSVGKQIFVDFWIVTAYLVTRLAGRDRSGGVFVARSDFPAGTTGPTGAAWRAFVTVASTWSANSYVVDINPDTRNRLSHDLVPKRSSESPA